VSKIDAKDIMDSRMKFLIALLKGMIALLYSISSLRKEVHSLLSEFIRFGGELGKYLA
jgi:hypothetical protein